MKVDIRYNNRKNARKWQEVRIKIHDRDLWSGNVTLSHILHAFLVRYAQEELRPSMAFYPERIQEIEDTERYEHVHAEAQRKWKECLDTMIYAFYWLKTDSTFGPHGKEIHKDLDEAVKEGVHKNRFEAWQPIFEKWDAHIKEHEHKIKEGLRLFAEHFQSLWT